MKVHYLSKTDYNIDNTTIILLYYDICALRHFAKTLYQTLDRTLKINKK
jgi:hypothetical protein